MATSLPSASSPRVTRSSRGPPPRSPTARIDPSVTFLRSPKPTLSGVASAPRASAIPSAPAARSPPSAQTRRVRCESLTCGPHETLAARRSLGKGPEPARRPRGGSGEGPPRRRIIGVASLRVGVDFLWLCLLWCPLAAAPPRRRGHRQTLNAAVPHSGIASRLRETGGARASPALQQASCDEACTLGDRPCLRPPAFSHRESGADARAERH